MKELVQETERKKDKRKGGLGENHSKRLESPHPAPGHACVHIVLLRTLPVPRKLTGAGAREPECLCVYGTEYVEVFKFASSWHTDGKPGASPGGEWGAESVDRFDFVAP